MSAVNVGNLLLLALAFSITRDFTVEKNLMSAVNVGNPLRIDRNSINTGELTLEKDLIDRKSVV